MYPAVLVLFPIPPSQPFLNIFLFSAKHNAVLNIFFFAFDLFEYHHLILNTISTTHTSTPFPISPSFPLLSLPSSHLQKFLCRLDFNNLNFFFFPPLNQSIQRRSVLPGNDKVKFAVLTVLSSYSILCFDANILRCFVGMDHQKYSASR